MTDHVVSLHLSKCEDGGYLVASSDSPRFCIKATTAEEAKAKALRLLKYYAEAKKRIDLSPKRTSVISPVYEEIELCA